MTDYSSVKNELMLIMDCNEDEVQKYEMYVQNAVCCVFNLLKNEEYENRAEIVHLCAAKAFYKISLIKEAGNCGVKSFKAGDISYTVDNSLSLAAEKVLADAAADCRNLIADDEFVFKAV